MNKTKYLFQTLTFTFNFDLNDTIKPSLIMAYPLQCLEPIPAGTEREVGSTLDRLPRQRETESTPTAKLEWPKKTYMSLECGRKPGQSEGEHALHKGAEFAENPELHHCASPNDTINQTTWCSVEETVLCFIHWKCSKIVLSMMTCAHSANGCLEWLGV